MVAVCECDVTTLGSSASARRMYPTGSAAHTPPQRPPGAEGKEEGTKAGKGTSKNREDKEDRDCRVYKCLLWPRWQQFAR
eukprot:363316-Chlamydomonas_euryale.AAC.4